MTHGKQHTTKSNHYHYSVWAEMHTLCIQSAPRTVRGMEIALNKILENICVYHEQCLFLKDPRWPPLSQPLPFFSLNKILLSFQHPVQIIPLLQSLSYYPQSGLIILSSGFPKLFVYSWYRTHHKAHDLICSYLFIYGSISLIKSILIEDKGLYYFPL